MSNERHDPVLPVPADLQLRCAKCGHRNPRTALICSRCGKHLYLGCKRCGHRNRRTVRKCTKCGRRLHRPLWHLLARKSFRGLSVIEIAILIVLAVVIVKLIQNAFEYMLPPREPQMRDITL